MPISTADAELYLRLLGEDRITDPDHNDSGLIAVASAFVAVGAIDLAVARSVAGEYAVAAELRGFGSGYAEPDTSRPLTKAPGAPRVAWVRIEDSESHGFRYAVLGDQHAEVTFSYTGNANWEQVAKNFPKPAGFPNSLLLEDDTGQGHEAHRNSQQMGGPWTGSFATRQPLSRNTRFLDIGGRRMTLLAADPPPRVSWHEIETDCLPAAYLRHLAAATVRTDFPEMGHVDQVATAFRDCGFVAADDQVLADVAAIAALPSGGPPARAVPDRWASLARGTAPGREGTLLLGAATPLLDGAWVAVIALAGTREAFAIDTWQTGGASPAAVGSVQPAPPIVWWARDDLDGWYLGSWQGFHNGDELGWRGPVTYSPALDPRATRLSLMPTALSSYAVIDIDLTGTWRPTA